ncbi:hypothetical protein GCM10009430_26200 [Aquimarina litoralis]|uniref:CAAX prenyl protease 2/Lysostaphin resistance protein A-like domain-containing protein n=1 Tax=Aquimarina litoralis TaxID=584605 RepID=A0ABN1IWY4_9FLAO
MLKSKFWNQLILFVIVLLATLMGKQYIIKLLMQKEIVSYEIHTLLNIGSNLLIVLVSILLIRKNELSEIAGIKNTKLKKKYFLIFPVVYLVLLNVLLMDEINRELLVLNIILFVIYSLSIGFAEEFSIRGFLQSHLIKHFGSKKKGIIMSVLISSLFFGLLHTIKFDKGIYGELSQVGYATFIGIMFGMLLVMTRRIYPLIIIHAIVDFVGDFDTIGVSMKNRTINSVSFEDAILITLLVLPCLLYGIFMMKKYQFQVIEWN